jgi:hypothetical protein
MINSKKNTLMMEVSRNGDTPKTLDGSRMENPYLAMDDDWGDTHFRKPPSLVCFFTIDHEINHY